MGLDYTWLLATVRQRFDSDAALEAALPRPLSAEALRRKGDDRYLSAMTQRVFRAGMSHTLVDAKWPAFEACFGGFAPASMAALDAADIAGFMQERRIIRHRAKLESIVRNARFILDVRRETGAGFGAFIADWPVEDIVGLWRLLARRGARLGGRSAAGFLRLAGKNTFLTTSHVIVRLAAAGIIDREPSGLRELQVMQAAFNALRRESGRPLCQLSALLALSVGPDGEPM